MLKKVIFDMDGLIFDSERLFMNCLKAEMTDRNYSLTEQIYVCTLGLSSKAAEKYMKERYGEQYPYHEISEAARLRMSELSKKGLPVKKGIFNLLKYLRSKNISCVVASSTKSKFVYSYLKSSGLSEYFSEIIGGDMVKNSKPAPDIFLKALGTAQKENTIVLEDSENGVKAAINAGIGVICIPDMKRPDKKILDLTLACVEDADCAVKVIASLTENH